MEIYGADADGVDEGVKPKRTVPLDRVYSVYIDTMKIVEYNTFPMKPHENVPTSPPPARPP